MIIKITQDGQEILKYFENKKNVKKVAITSTELRTLGEDEISTLTESVVYKILDGINKDLVELSLKESKKIHTTAEKIVKYLREY